MNQQGELFTGKMENLGPFIYFCEIWYNDSSINLTSTATQNRGYKFISLTTCKRKNNPDR
jgi:hypothetical protein